MNRHSAVSPLRVVALVATAGLTLAACNSADDPGAADSPSPTPTSTVNVPESVALTDPGEGLSFGDTAEVIYEPNQHSGTVLGLTVRKATKGSLEDFSSFILDKYTKSATPYYVDVTVENVGEGKVGGTPVPLWGVDGENTLLPAASFTTTFTRCRSKPLPDKFAPGDSLDACLVYLAPDEGTLEAVSFRPNQEFDPIQWTGDIATPKPKPTKKSG